MKYTATKTIILTAAIISAISFSSSAQYLASVSRHNISNVNTNAEDNNTAAGTTTAASEKAAAVMAYMRSAQFVVDNLSSLKKDYAVSDIYFDLDQSLIRKDARPVLDDLASLMDQQMEISVAVTAHCDSRMSAYNTVLAVKRAESAKAYLVAKGIDANRIVIEKHGRPSVKNPCTDNPGCSIAEQESNRKTEFNIIYNNLNLAHMSSFND